MAVLIANEGPVRKVENMHRLNRPDTVRQSESGSHTIIDGEERNRAAQPASAGHPSFAPR